MFSSVAFHLTGVCMCMHVMCVHVCVLACRGQKLTVSSSVILHLTLGGRVSHV